MLKLNYFVDSAAENKAKFLKITAQIMANDEKMVATIKPISDRILKGIRKARDDSKRAKGAGDYIYWESAKAEKDFIKAYKAITQKDFQSEKVELVFQKTLEKEKRYKIFMKHYQEMLTKADNIYESNRAALSHLRSRLKQHEKVAQAAKWHENMIAKEQKYLEKRKAIHKVLIQKAKEYEASVKGFLQYL